MSTETLDPQVEEAGIPDEGPSTLPFEAPSVEVGGEDPELELAIADAHAEGMPVPPDPEAKPRLWWEDRPQGLEWAMEQIIAVNKQVIDQKATVKEAQAVVKDEKETLESLQDQLNRLILDAEKARAEADPDPERFPLFDKSADPNAEAKAEINEQFSKPEAVAPLPPDTIEEHFRRCKRDTPLADIGLPAKVVEILAGAGFKMVIDLDQLEGKDLATIKSDAGTITEKRAEQVRDAIEAAAEGWMAAWYDAHPDDRPGIEEGANLALKSIRATT